MNLRQKFYIKFADKCDYPTLVGVADFFISEICKLAEDHFTDINCPGFGDHTRECLILTEAKESFISKVKEANKE